MNNSSALSRSALSVAMLSLLIVAGRAGSEERRPPLKVGLIVPLSGPGAEFGIACKNGLEMAISELPTGTIELVVEDDELTPRKTVAAFKKLTTIDRTTVVLGISSSTSNSIAPLAEASKIPLIAWANDPKIGRGRDYVVLSERSAVDEGKVAARETIRRNYSSVALVSVISDYPQAFAAGLSKELGDNLTIHEEVPPDAVDFRTLAAKIKAREPASVGLCLNPGQFEAFSKAATELSFNPAYFGCHSIEGSIGEFSSAWYTTIDVSQDFRDRYLTRFGNEKVLSGAAIHYETGKLLATLYDRLLDKSQETIPELLMRLPPRLGAVGRFSVIKRNKVAFFDVPITIRDTARGRR